MLDISPLIKKGHKLDSYKHADDFHNCIHSKVIVAVTAVSNSEGHALQYRANQGHVLRCYYYYCYYYSRGGSKSL